MATPSSLGQGTVPRANAQARTRLLGALGLGALGIYLWMYRDSEKNKHPVRHSLVYGEPHGVGPVTSARTDDWKSKGAMAQRDGGLDATPAQTPSHVIAHYPAAGSQKHVQGIAWAGTDRARPVTMAQHDAKHT